MRLVVDVAICAGYAVCESLNDELFQVGGSGPVTLLHADVPSGSETDAEAAVASCPTGALRIERSA